MAYTTPQMLSFVAGIAKDITVAKASSDTHSPNAETGKKTAEFYTEVFNGVMKALKEAEKME